MGVRSVIGNGDDEFGGGEDLELLTRDLRRQEAIDQERELNIYRSGSASPTVEGSFNAMGGLYDREMAGCLPGLSKANNLNQFSAEEELRSSLEYLSYYYANVNLNPQLPPPLLPKEDQRLSQRNQTGNSEYGGIGDMRKMGCREDLGRNTPVSNHPSRPTSRNTFSNDVASIGFAYNQIISNNEGADELNNVSGLSSDTLPSVVGSSIRRNTTLGPQLVARARGPGLPPVGVRVNTTDRKVNSSSSFNSISSVGVASENLISSLSGLSLSRDGIPADDDFTQSNLHKEYDDQHCFLFTSQSGENNSRTNLGCPDEEFLNMPSNQQGGRSSYPYATNVSGAASNRRLSKARLNVPVESQRSSASSATFLKASSEPSIDGHGVSPVYHQNFNGAFTSYGMDAHAINPALSLLSPNSGIRNLPMSSVASASPVLSLGIDSRSLRNNVFAPPNLVGAANLQNFSALGNQPAAAAALQEEALNDPLYIQYLKAAEYTRKICANRKDLPMERGYSGNALPDLLELHNAYLGTLLKAQKQHNMPVPADSSSFNHGYYGNPSFGIGMSYQGSPLTSPIASPAGPGSPLRLGDERDFGYSSGLRNSSGCVLGSWNSGPGNKTDEQFPSSLLEDFKTTKTRCFELTEIAGHVVEFSSDQYGSRFIQQKLETATVKEKSLVFEEIIPHALSLMTDVFGNYVIQKFFEYGSMTQRKELANKLIGHVLALSLQMYGCRVIQKAIEVVDLDQRTKMVSELDGHVMRCVRDQNGNHVIQKCIECCPQEAIQFIISTFYDHVVTLSTHPYGCRVIQRVLEHCDDPKTQQLMMDEILPSVCMLAQDQYGNYVVQHVLEYGKPHERSEIIRKLAGQIVQMSQQKFASNVVEKCLTFGGLEERQILVNEMLGSTDENEPLQAMMKDQFANYVVQKVLETCDDQQRELILSRIKVHLTALKKYTFGKHIVARVEKLVAAGERRIGLQPPQPL